MINSFIRTPSGMSLFINGSAYTVQDTHHNYHQIVQAVRDKRWDEVPGLINLCVAIKRSLSADDDELVVDTNEGTVKFRGDHVRGVIVTRILDMVALQFDITPMKRFLSNLYDNPSNKAVEQLYGWMEANGITITEDGYLLAFKRVRDDFKSFHDGTTDNSIGTTPSLPRNKVDDRSEVTCSYGLHFCSHAYLPEYHGGQGRVLLLKINPRDVVSIPTDYNNAKGRACAYLVLDELKGDARKGIETHNVIPQPVITEQTDYNASNDYKDGYLAGYKDGRGKKALHASADYRIHQSTSDYSTGYQKGRVDGRNKNPNLYASAVVDDAQGAADTTNHGYRADIQQRLLKLLVEPLQPISPIQLDHNFVDDWGVDDLEMLGIVTDVEDEFGIEISDEEATKLATVRNLFELICSKLV